MTSRGSFLFFTALLANAQTGYLTYPNLASPDGIATADFNGDGKPDIVTVNLGANRLTILLNNGTSGFTALAPINFGQAPRAVLTADLNGDHKIDLLVLGVATVPQGPPGGPAVLLGNGDGTFQPPLPVAGCPQVTGAQIGDLDGDGIPDLALSCLTGGFLVPTGAYLSIVPGKGDGTYGPGVSFSLGFTPWATLTIGDFDRDGKPDVAVVSGGGNLTMLLNGGSGNFRATSSVIGPWNFAPGIVTADFNSDRIPDLAVTSQAQGNLARGVVSVLLGNGDGTFKVAANLPAAGFGQVVARDLNGDGYIDLAAGQSAVTFYAGRGDGTFQNGLPFGGSANSDYLALADFTGTGVVGFASTNSSGTVVILPRPIWPSLGLANTSAAGFGLGPMAPGSIATAFGSNLATQVVTVTDSAGISRPAPVSYSSATQVNYLVPDATTPGIATVRANSESGSIAIEPVAPALFTVNADNLAAANVLRISQNGDRVFESIYQRDPNGVVTALPIDLSAVTDTVYVSLYGTGIRHISNPALVSAIAGGSNAPVIYAGPQGTLPGVDQVNILLPHGLAAPNPYTVSVQVVADGQPSNRVTLLIQ